MAVTPHRCSSCGSSLPTDAIFCPRCGVATVPAAGSAPRLPSWLPAVGAAVAVVAALGLVVWRGSAVPRAAAAPTAVPAPADPPAIPDISAMTPKERFDRLYGRIMQALRSGDAATLSRFAPMALAAYQMIDSADVDSLTRRRATLLRLHLGDTTAARSLSPRAGPLPPPSTGRKGP